MAALATVKVAVPYPVHVRLTAYRAGLRKRLKRQVTYGEAIERLVAEHEQAQAAKAGRP